MEKTFTKSKIFDLCYFIVCYLYVIVMWATGWNFLPLIATALATACAFIIFVRILRNQKCYATLWLAYVVLIAGTFLFFLGHSAESFAKTLGYNLLLSIFPIALALTLRFLRLQGKKEKVVKALIAIGMTGTAIVYLFFMNLRLTPTAESLQRGHDEYLNSLSKADRATNSPNVLFILMDDMAYADLSCYSYLGSENATINTPNIDSIADNGIFMENFYASAPVCSPSRFSALTGRYSARGYLDNVIFPTTLDTSTNPYSITHFINPYQFLNNVDGILGDEITIAEALNALGYDTYGVGKWNLGDYGEYLPTNQGFDYFYGSYYVNDMTPYNWVEERDGIGVEVRTSADNKDQSQSTKIFTQKVNDCINQSIENGENFFMYYASPWPHFPIFSDDNGNGKGDTTDDTYIACIEEFDSQLGLILQNLKDKGVYDDTIIIFTSDNGPGREGVTGSLRGRKNTTFEGGMKVPMLISYPNGGVGAGTAVPSTQFTIVAEDGNRIANTKRIVSSAMLTDVFPTILDYVMGDNFRLPADRVIDGVSLRALISGDVARDTRVHDQLFYIKGGKVQGIQKAVTTPDGTFDYKYYKSVHTENSAFIDQFYKNYLFNLDLDPAEGYNVAKTYPSIAEDLKESLAEFKKELKDNRRGIK